MDTDIPVVDGQRIVAITDNLSTRGTQEVQDWLKHAIFTSEGDLAATRTRTASGPPVGGPLRTMAASCTPLTGETPGQETLMALMLVAE